MNFLFKTAIKNKKHYVYLLFAVLLMWMSTIAGQLEMFSLGVISHKGADFFELFSEPKSKGVSLEQVHESWANISQGDDVISRDRAFDYLLQQDRNSLFKRGFAFFDQKMQISDKLTNLAKFLLLIALFNAITSFGSRYFSQVVAIRVSRDLREQYFQHIQKLPMAFYHKYNIGSLSSRVVSDASTIASAINSLLINYVQTPFTMLSSLAVCFYLSFNLSLIIFFGLPLIVLPLLFLATKVKKISKEIQKNQESFASVLIDFLAGIQTVKIFVMEEFSFQKYREQNNRMAVLEEKNARYSYSSRPITHMLASLFLVFVILYGLYREHMSLAEIVFFCGILHLFYDPIKKFAEENNSIQRGMAAAERMYEVLSLKPNIKDEDGAIDLEKMQDSIEFRNVWFRYDNKWILKDVSFKAEKGQIVALVGPTGAGKSTIAQLLPRLYDVEKGEILIDGKPLKAYKQMSLRENIAFVPQKPFLFLDTVAENIAFGRGFSREQITQAAKKAHADEFIQGLDQTYDSLLLEAGKNLSGGQQQRLAIARALVKDAPILIMDEATSALDSVSENRIKMAVRELKGTVTQILIAHRLSTIEDADKIIYLEDGAKIAEGTKDELLKTCSNFRVMWEMTKQAS